MKIKGVIRRREGSEGEELLCFKEWKEARWHSDTRQGDTRQDDTRQGDTRHSDTSPLHPPFMATLPPALTWWWWYWWCWHVHYVKLMRVFLRPMQLMINTSSCKYYCVRSCMYVRAQVCDTLPHMATVGRDSHGASHVCPAPGHTSNPCIILIH